MATYKAIFRPSFRSPLTALLAAALRIPLPITLIAVEAPRYSESASTVCTLAEIFRAGGRVCECSHHASSTERIYRTSVGIHTANLARNTIPGRHAFRTLTPSELDGVS